MSEQPLKPGVITTQQLAQLAAEREERQRQKETPVEKKEVKSVLPELEPAPHGEQPINSNQARAQVGDIVAEDDFKGEINAQGPGAIAQAGKIEVTDKAVIMIIGKDGQAVAKNIKAGKNFNLQLSADSGSPGKVEILAIKREVKELAGRVEKIEFILEVDPAANKEREEIAKDQNLADYYGVMLQIGWHFAGSQALASGEVAGADDAADVAMDVIGATLSLIPVAGNFLGGPVELAKHGIKALKGQYELIKHERLANFVPNPQHLGRIIERFARKATLAKSELIKEYPKEAKQAQAEGKSKPTGHAIGDWWSKVNGGTPLTAVQRLAAADVEEVVDAIKKGDKIKKVTGNDERAITATVDAMVGVLKPGSAPLPGIVPAASTSRSAVSPSLTPAPTTTTTTTAAAAGGGQEQKTTPQGRHSYSNSAVRFHPAPTPGRSNQSRTSSDEDDCLKDCCPIL